MGKMYTFNFYLFVDPSLLFVGKKNVVQVEKIKQFTLRFSSKSSSFAQVLTIVWEITSSKYLGRWSLHEAS